MNRGRDNTQEIGVGSAEIMGTSSPKVHIKDWKERQQENRGAQDSKWTPSAWMVA